MGITYIAAYALFMRESNSSDRLDISTGKTFLIGFYHHSIMHQPNLNSRFYFIVIQIISSILYHFKHKLNVSGILIG